MMLLDQVPQTGGRAVDAVRSTEAAAGTRHALEKLMTGSRLLIGSARVVEGVIVSRARDGPTTENPHDRRATARVATWRFRQTTGVVYVRPIIDVEPAEFSKSYAASRDGRYRL